ncbi:hypothetical protein HanIR_Chr14g0720581 [Helianthus annuus]|nr:hypothetical protein HanIR_Chr14g0720581 [Helianthus annuus]
MQFSLRKIILLRAYFYIRVGINSICSTFAVNFFWKRVRSYIIRFRLKKHFYVHIFMCVLV